MKRIILSVLAMSALLCGCQKDHVSELTQERGTIQATIEEISATRTVMDENNNIRWSEGDQIVGFMRSTLGMKYQVSAASVGKTSASFEEVSSGGLNAGTELEHIIAYYPYSSSVSAAKSGSNYTLDVILPTEQTYVAGSFGNGAMPMVAVSETNNITFRNVCGGMKLQLKGTSKIASIKVEGKNNEKLSGKASVTAYTDGSKPSIAMADDASTSAVLNCGSGVQLNQDDATDFIISLPPTVFTKGFTITVTDVNGGAQVIETSKSNTVLRSSLLKMPVVSVEITTTPQEGDYVDEYGINHGQGIEIDGVVWAPVNCGYHATDFKYGKLYQWGRKYGQGYNGQIYSDNSGQFEEYSDALIPMIEHGGVSDVEGNNEDKANTFLIASTDLNYDWANPHDDRLWSPTSEVDPIKTDYDPCPMGWRVPTKTELKNLSQNYSSWMTNDDGIYGRWFSGSCTYSAEAPQVFFVAAGGRTGYDGEADSRCQSGNYWSSTTYEYSAYDLNLNRSAVCLYYHYGRATGYSVRCVKDNAKAVPVEVIRLNKTSLVILVNEKEKLFTKITPSSSYSSNVEWSSDNINVATVDVDGVVHAVSVGTATITAQVGGKMTACIVKVIDSASYQIGDYVDEYGINHGQGVEIDGVVWAPVNCGYHATDFKYGKLYQWGRKYGQGYNGDLIDEFGHLAGSYTDAVIPSIQDGGVSAFAGSDIDNANVFYLDVTYSSDWASPYDDSLWNFGSESDPIKTDYDPCPIGWRVPTYAELNNLRQIKSDWTTEHGQSGYWFSGGVFLPAAGEIFSNGSSAYRGYYGSYWSSSPRLDTHRSYYLNIDDYFTNIFSELRSSGFSVRCVLE